ncbi:alpha/beta hydrolase [Bacillus tianshenii]|nr:alpha/beta hydrolase [Bacillus tianshenii]
MDLKKEIFSFGGQWNVVHLPEKPNGFAIMLIGDTNHYVDEQTSLWLQNPERLQLINQLVQQGYTIFYSHLYGRHWGSDKTVEFLKQLYAYMIRKEILNPRVHLLAEGMGALTALKMMERIPEWIRSAAFLSPCIDLKQYFSSEKKNRVFYKKLQKELAESYEVPEEKVASHIIEPFSIKDFHNTIPLKIWHSTNRTAYPVLEHSRPYEAHREVINAPISLSIHLFEKRFTIYDAIGRFYHIHEKNL